MTLLRSLAAALILALAVAGTAIAAPGGNSKKAPPTRSSHPDDVPGRVVVTLRPDANARAAAAEYRRLGVSVYAHYSAALNGFAADVPDHLRPVLAADPRVERVDQDRVVRLASTQTNPPWGLDRIDQRDRPLSSSYTAADDGTGVTVYVLDTGVRASHSSFGGRVTAGYDAYGAGSTDDCHGHGTAVAGVAGSSTHGVAKGVTIVPVRVLQCDGSGTWSAVIAGVDWITAQHQPGQPAVANLSLSGDVYEPVETAIRGSVADGIVYVAAAGNQGIDACGRTPARMPELITVAATNAEDERPTWSNTGSCVDLFAPGHKIPAPSATSDTATGTRTGTSLAAPHVAGVAALHLVHQPDALPDAVRGSVLADGTTGVVVNLGGAPNLLAHSPDEHTAWPAPPPAPEPSPEPSPSPSPSPEPSLLPLPLPSLDEVAPAPEPSPTLAPSPQPAPPAPDLPPTPVPSPVEPSPVPLLP